MNKKIHEDEDENEKMKENSEETRLNSVRSAMYSPNSRRLTRVSKDMNDLLGIYSRIINFKNSKKSNKRAKSAHKSKRKIFINTAPIEEQKELIAVKNKLQIETEAMKNKHYPQSQLDSKIL